MIGGGQTLVPEILGQTDPILATKWLYTRPALCIAILVLLTTWLAVCTYARFLPIHTACRVVNGIEMPVYTVDL